MTTSTLTAVAPATRTTGWKPVLAAVPLAAAHLGLTVYFSANWDGDETRGSMTLAFLCAVVGLGLVLAAVARTGGWSGGGVAFAGRVVAGLTGAVLVVAVGGGLWIARDPLSDSADGFFDVAMWSLMGGLTVAVLLAVANASWPTSYRRAIAPLALLGPVAASSVVLSFEGTWWAWNVLIAVSIVLAGLVLGRPPRPEALT